MIEQRFQDIEDKRRKRSITKVKKAIVNSWCTKEDPSGQRLKVVKSHERRDGMSAPHFIEVERQNKILFDKMSKIMTGNYQTSTKRDFSSCKLLPFILSF